MLCASQSLGPGSFLEAIPDKISHLRGLTASVQGPQLDSQPAANSKHLPSRRLLQTEHGEKLNLSHVLGSFAPAVVKT